MKIGPLHKIFLIKFCEKDWLSGELSELNLRRIFIDLKNLKIMPMILYKINDFVTHSDSLSLFLSICHEDVNAIKLSS